VFDIYNYDKHWISNPYKRNRIFEQISYSSPDIICLQEFVDDKGGKFKILDTLPLFQKAKNFHFEYSKNVRNLNFFGIATFSKYPIISKGRINFPNSKNNLCIYTDINADGKIIRVYNMHLQSIRFNEENYEFADKLRNINNINPDEKFKAESKKILRRLKKGFLKRAPQSEIIAEHIKTSPYPFIICGDFNDTPSSYSYYKISDNLSDAFSESGNGLGLTYAGGSFPAFRIDYILHSPSLKSYGYKCERVYYSDHFPVECYISF
jgi:endonuclease/exonuclease/phosphatase family metal-dependent hydrolase